MDKLQTLGDLIKKGITIISDASYLSGYQQKLEDLLTRLSKQELTLPLVGEFSSGKSTLVNSLLGRKIIAVDVLPTTFTVNEIYFSSEVDKIEVFSEDGALLESVDGLREVELKLDSDAMFVKIFTKSDVLPKGVKIVDLPGLSSTIERHNEVLINYVVNADAILLIVDSNQATVTLSTKRFLEFTNLLNREIYLVYTKSDLKSEKELDELYQYAQEKLPVKPIKIIFTSAKNNDVGQFVEMVNFINDRKHEILFKNVAGSFISICDSILKVIDNQMIVSKLNVSEIDNEIKNLNEQLSLLEDEFKKKIKGFEERISALNSEIVSYFEKTIRRGSERLVNMAFENPDGLESAFDNLVKSSVKDALELYQKKLGMELSGLEQGIQKLSDSIDVGASQMIKSSISGITSIITVVLVDILAPGGMLSALLYTVLGNFARKIGLLGNLFEKLLEPIRNIAVHIVKGVTKTYVSNKISKAIEDVKNEFASTLVSESKNIIDKLCADLYNEFETSRAGVLSSIEVLKEQKQRKIEEFNNYLNNLKNKRDAVDELIEKVKPLVN